MNIRVLTLNIHKGFTQFNLRFMLHELRDAIRQAGPDIVFLQEVQGEHRGKENEHEDWPDEAQYEFLADEVWSDFAYGQNAAYTEGHHGNAILSKFPIEHWEQVDISTNWVEQRGHLYSRLFLPDQNRHLHCVCMHLGLSALSRRKQLHMISEYIDAKVPADEPLVVAGDTNDWTGIPTKDFADRAGLRDASLDANGGPLRTFPAKRPLLCLDRIYTRGFNVRSTLAADDAVWRELSDHVPLMADLNLKPAHTAKSRG